MVKVTGLNELAQAIEDVEFARKFNRNAKKEIRKQRIAELVANGVDKEMAAIMADAFIAFGV